MDGEGEVRGRCRGEILGQKRTSKEFFFFFNTFRELNQAGKHFKPEGIWRELIYHLMELVVFSVVAYFKSEIATIGKTECQYGA